MDRREPDPGGSGVETSKAWQTVRRALGRLFSRVGVRSLADDEREIAAPVLRADLALPPPALSPREGWKLTVFVREVTAPQATTGLRESNLLPAVTLVRGDYALETLSLQAMAIASAATVGVEHASLDWPAEVTRLPDTFMRLPQSPVRVGAGALIALPKTASLRAWQVTMPAVTLLRMPRQAEPRVRWGGDAVLRRMPLTRRGRGTGRNVPATDEFRAERRRLAETVHLQADEVTLLGVYLDVPILAVERIMVEDEGRQLRLWIKPEVLRGRSASHRITLLVGRQNSTGKMLQAAL